MPLFFIRRPNFAWVVALFISLGGLLAIPFLPVAQYPNVAPPQITVTATYPGASAQVLTDSVTSVIEEELNGAKNLLYFESTSNANGIAEITVTFQPGPTRTGPGRRAEPSEEGRGAHAAGRADPRHPDRAGHRRLPADLCAELHRWRQGLRCHGAGRLRGAQYQQRNPPGDPVSANCSSSPPRRPCACGSIRRSWSATACPSMT